MRLDMYIFFWYVYISFADITFIKKIGESRLTEAKPWFSFARKLHNPTKELKIIAEKDETREKSPCYASNSIWYILRFQ